MLTAFIYPGGKVRLSSWVISHFPRHKIYVEPFGGAAGVLLNKTPSPLEVYNDLNSDLVNFFRVLRDKEKAAELIRRLRLTPYAREEYYSVYPMPKDDDIERARSDRQGWYGVRDSRGCLSKTRWFRHRVEKN